MTTGNKIKALREERGMTQYDLAVRIGVSQARISHYETGRRDLSLELAANIATALGVSVDDLLPAPIAAQPTP